MIARAPRRGGFWLVAVLLLLLTPLAEIFVIIQVGQVIGAWPTVILLLLESALGAWLVRREGGRAWQALRIALQTGRMPGRELADAALVLIGGVLLLAPGFITDLLGFLIILPGTRAVARRLLQATIEKQLMQRAGIISGTIR